MSRFFAGEIILCYTKAGRWILWRKNLILFSDLWRRWLFYFCWLPVQYSFFRTEEYKDWTAVPGVVFKREWVRNFRVRIYYTYTVDGERYTGSELYHRSNGTAEAGDETLIWYDPENPAHSSYHKPGPGLDPYGVYFLMAPLAVAWLAENHRKS